MFQDVTHSLGFNIELKFDNKIVYKEHELVRVIQLVLEVHQLLPVSSLMLIAELKFEFIVSNVNCTLL